MSPKTVRPKKGTPYQLPRIRWGSEAPPKPVEAVKGQMPLPLDVPPGQAEATN